MALEELAQEVAKLKRALEETRKIADEALEEAVRAKKAAKK